jgi:hypothetical protein
MEDHMSFESDLFEWIDKSLAEPIDSSVIAFCFDLYEPDGIELIGSSSFDANNREWASSDDFIPSQRGMDIPEDVCSWNRKECLETMTALIKRYLASDRPGAKVLLSCKGVAIGFVDSDLEIISQN